MSEIDSDAPADSFEILSKGDSDSNESFLSILDEKNKVIQLLQQQLANQKLQILYYMKKDLSCTKLAELSNTCSLEYLENSLPVVLSLENFRKENGIKSSLYRLYEYMKDLDGRLNKSLNCQEYILRKIIEKICVVMKDPSNVNLNLKLNSAIQQNMCLDLFNSLLDATVCLRKKLESFRICCNRLILIEEERNSLVEQVVTLPADEKFNCNFIMSIKQDKRELEKKIRLLTEKKNLQCEEMKELNYMEKKLAKLENDLKVSINESGDFSNVDDMVKNLNVEAKYLLHVTKKHQEKRQNNRNKTLKHIIQSIKIAFEGGEINSSKINKEELEIFDVIKKEIETIKNKTKIEIEKTKTDSNEIKNHLNEALIEKNKLKIANIHLQSYIEKLQKNYTSEILLLKQQRDNFEAQVEDLEELRKSYTELIIMPNSENSNKEKELSQTIKHLEKKLQLMKEIIQKQNKEITIQSEFIDNLKSQYEKKRNSDQQNSLFAAIDKKESVSVSGIDVQELTLNQFLNWSDEKQIISEDNSNYFKLFSKNTEIKEVMKEIVETMNKSAKPNKKSNLSSYSLQIKCSCKKGRPTSNCNESELMRDCSNESLAIFCRPIQKNKDNKILVENQYSPVESGYSRNIEVLVQNNNRLKNSSSEDYNT